MNQNEGDLNDDLASVLFIIPFLLQRRAKSEMCMTRMNSHGLHRSLFRLSVNAVVSSDVSYKVRKTLNYDDPCISWLVEGNGLLMGLRSLQTVRVSDIYGHKTNMPQPIDRLSRRYNDAHVPPSKFKNKEWPVGTWLMNRMNKLILHAAPCQEQMAAHAANLNLRTCIQPIEFLMALQVQTIDTDGSRT